MSGIIWLASYPKSGNTWLRVFLANLMSASDEPVDINELHSIPIASARDVFDETVGIEASDLYPDEIECLRPGVFERWAEESDGPLFLKIHDAYTSTPWQSPLVPPAVTAGVIYIIRNPLDVAVSFANHMGVSIDEAIRRMADPDFAFSSKRTRLDRQLRQRLLTWSEHVTNWVDAPGLRVHVVRYEDMKERPLETFAAAAAFAGLDADRGRIEQAIRFSDFSALQAQERECGFRERSPKAQAFFRRGEAAAWRGSVTPYQVSQVVAEHAEVMRRFGYLDGAGNVVHLCRTSGRAAPCRIQRE